MVKNERTKETTHKIMSAIKPADTEPELLLRRALWSKGLRYRKNVRSLPGKPDIVFTKDRIAVFCDGDFWHGHNWVLRGVASFEEELASYSEYWRKKLSHNVKRDEEITAALESAGWLVIRIWESDIRKDVDNCVSRITSARSLRASLSQQ